MNLVERTSGRTLAALLLVTGLTGCGQVSDGKCGPRQGLLGRVGRSDHLPGTVARPAMRTYDKSNEESDTFCYTRDRTEISTGQYRGCSSIAWKSMAAPSSTADSEVMWNSL